MSTLADRIRGIVTPGGATAVRGAGTVSRERPSPLPPIAQHTNGAEPADHRGRFEAVEHALGGTWCDGCFVIDRRLSPGARHGRDAVGTFAECLDDGSAQARLFAGGAAAPPFVFFDLETTGLSGGAGTQAFLIGCAWFDDDGSFVTRQLLLTRSTEEHPLLQAAAAELARAGTLVSFNGKSFDVPMLETRYLFHRLEPALRALPHVDVLHPARRFWKTQGSRPRTTRYAATGVAGLAHPPGAVASDTCTLTALERQVLGVRRSGDVPGIEIPRRYFQFVRTGDPRPLAGVIEHNRLDLLTLAALASRLFHVARHGPEAARDAREALALGHVYMRADLVDRALEAYSRAVEMTEQGVVSQLVRIESLRALALTHRRARDYRRSAACWRRLLDAPGCPPLVVREATEALAVHHEHRERDLEAARRFALQSLEVEQPPRWATASRYRLARLDRKIAAVESLKFEI